MEQVEVKKVYCLQKRVMGENLLVQQSFQVPRLMEQEQGACLKERVEAMKALLHRQRKVMDESLLVHYSRYLLQSN